MVSILVVAIKEVDYSRLSHDLVQLRSSMCITQAQSHLGELLASNIDPSWYSLKNSEHLEGGEGRRGGKEEGKGEEGRGRRVGGERREGRRGEEGKEE